MYIIKTNHPPRVVFLCPFFERKRSMDTDYLTQFLTWMLGALPGDVAANLVGGITFVVTFCTVVVRFWKEPASGTIAHKVWTVIHLLASFKKAASKS